MSTSSAHRLAFVTAAAAASCLVAHIARAQEQESGSEPAALEEITVTARRKEENLQTTPVSVSAFTDQMLTDRSITNVADLGAHVPNLQYQIGAAGGSGANFYIRGVGSADFIAALDPGVATYIDGVYLGRTTGGAVDLLDVARVEVLRGPQGTLFGRNAVGGAINVVTAKPEGGFSGVAEMSGGQRSRFEGRLSLNVPLIAEALTGRVSVRAQSQDGYGFDTNTGQRVGDRDTVSGRVALRLKPASSEWTVDLATDFQHVGGSSDLIRAVALNPFVYPDGDQYVTGSHYTTTAGYVPSNTLDVWGTALTTEYAASDTVTLKSITAFRSQKQDAGVDFDTTPLVVADQENITHQDQFSEELQLLGNSFDGRLNWVAGLYYFSERVLQDIELHSEVFFGGTLSQINHHENESYAAFAQGTFDITDRLSGTVGLRYSEDRKEQTFNHNFLIGGATIPVFDDVRVHDSWSSVTPKLGFEFKPTNRTMLYVSAAEGYRSGGFNGRPANTAEISSYNPETLTSYEAGFKSQLWSDRIRFNGSVFYTNYEDIQVTLATSTPTGPAIIAQNAAKAVTRGAELELVAKPTTALQFDAAVGFLHAKYTEVDPRAAYHDGDDLLSSPNWTASAGGEYQVRFSGQSQLSGRIDYLYKSAFYFFTTGSSTDQQEAYDVVNVRLRYGPQNDRWEVSAYGLNIFGTEYSLFRQDALASYGQASEWPAPPAEWGLGFRLNF